MALYRSDLLNAPTGSRSSILSSSDISDLFFLKRISTKELHKFRRNIYFGIPQSLSTSGGDQNSMGVPPQDE